jgi:hypothetical protein
MAENERLGSSGNRGNSGESGRDRYRDNDDERQIDDAGTRNDLKSDSRNEARGDARENIGNHARGTDADPTGPSGNDKTKNRSDLPDQYDDDLARDNRRGREGEGMSDLAMNTRAGSAGFLDGDMPPSDPHTGDPRHGWRSHARQGNAESPVELTHNEPTRKQEGHGATDLQRKDER